MFVPTAADSQSVTSTVTLESVQAIVDHGIGGLEIMIKDIMSAVGVERTNNITSTNQPGNTGESYMASTGTS